MISLTQRGGASSSYGQSMYVVVCVCVYFLGANLRRYYCWCDMWATIWRPFVAWQAAPPGSREEVCAGGHSISGMSNVVRSFVVRTVLSEESGAALGQSMWWLP